MGAIVSAIQAVGGYIYTAGESVVVGTGNILSTAGESIIAVGKAIFLGTGIGS
jgi:hypothetical protein